MGMQYAQHDSRNVTRIHRNTAVRLPTMDGHGDVSIQEGVDLWVAAGRFKRAYNLHLTLVYTT